MDKTELIIIKIKHLPSDPHHLPPSPELPVIETIMDATSTDDSIRIKDYQIHLPPLGEGAYGRVFRATYRGISDRAVKIFRSGAVDLSTMARELEKR